MGKSFKEGAMRYQMNNYKGFLGYSFRLFFILLAMCVVSCASITRDQDDYMQWHSIELPPLGSSWMLVKKKESKMVYERFVREGQEKPGIYIEYNKYPKDTTIAIEDVFIKLKEDFEAIYDDVDSEAIRINNVRSYRIHHSIIKEGRNYKLS